MSLVNDEVTITLLLEYVYQQLSIPQFPASESIDLEKQIISTRFEHPTRVISLSEVEI
jgi:hypothetical protein